MLDIGLSITNNNNNNNNINNNNNNNNNKIETIFVLTYEVLFLQRLLKISFSRCIDLKIF